MCILKNIYTALGMISEGLRIIRLFSKNVGLTSFIIRLDNKKVFRQILTLTPKFLNRQRLTSKKICQILNPF